MLSLSLQDYTGTYGTPDLHQWQICYICTHHTMELCIKLVFNHHQCIKSHISAIKLCLIVAEDFWHGQFYLITVKTGKKCLVPYFRVTTVLLNLLMLILYVIVSSTSAVSQLHSYTLFKPWLCLFGCLFETWSFLLSATVSSLPLWNFLSLLSTDDSVQYSSHLAKLPSGHRLSYKWHKHFSVFIEDFLIWQS